MKHERPELSVVMACFNAASYIGEAIESVLNQSFRNFELIVVDGASMDRTPEIIKQYASKDSRIIPLGEEVNSGPAVARNIAFQMAKGEFMAVLDSDDIAFPTRLEMQASYLRAKPHVVMLGSGCVEIDAAGNHVNTYRYPSGNATLVDRLRTLKPFPPHSSMVFRAQIATEVGGFNTRFVASEDRDLFLRLSELGSIECLPQPLIKLRKHPLQLSLEKSGETVVVMATAGIICHFLRIGHRLDPSAQDTRLWSEFVEWTRDRLQEEGVLEATKFWQTRKREWLADIHKPVLSRAFALSKSLARSGYWFEIIRSKFFGSRLPEKLAAEWTVLSR